MKITIPESDMLFGEFNEEDLFHIEKSNIYKDIGSNIKTVEFILKQKNNIILLEAKKAVLMPPIKMNLTISRQSLRNIIHP